MYKTDSLKVTPELSGERLDRVLQNLTDLSRKKVKGLLDQGRVRVNDRKVVIASWVMQPRDRIEIGEEGGEVPQSSGEKFFLKVIFEDKDLLVIEKDAGIACEKSPIATRPTIVSIVNAYFKRKSPHLKHHYLGLVHRLDQETSGLMVYTKTKEANRIAGQFKRHTIKRKYLALVEGRIEDQGGKIESYLQKSDFLRGGKKVKLSTPASGQKAITFVRVLERYHNTTLVEVTLNTGRTHQIRVHMASIGHPVIGDKIYGRREEPALPGRSGHAGGLGGAVGVAALRFQRQALHASFLGFHHPITGKKMEFKSELPRDLRRLVDRFRIRA